MSTAFPASIRIRRSRLDLNENIASTESPFTRKRQTVTLAGGTADRWEGMIETVPLKGTELRTMWAWLNKVGLYGQFTIGDPDYTGPISGATTGSVKGAGQSGTSLIVDGVATSTLILREGEYFQVRDEFKIATADCTANGSGEVTLNFKPALRVSPADNDSVIFNTPKMLLHLLTVPSKDTDDDGVAIFNVAFEEVLVGE